MVDDVDVWRARDSLPKITSDTSVVTETFTAVGGQTVFDLTLFIYEINTGSVLVFQEGNLLIPLTDYTETDQDTITLAVGATVGDTITVVGFLGSIGASVTAFYLGTYAAEPTTDLLGTPLDASHDGYLFFNTTTNALGVWNNPAWTYPTIATAADAISTAADAAATAADAAATAADLIATNQDTIDTAADAAATAADLVATNQDAIDTAADAAQTALDAINTSADAASTAADVITVQGIYDTFDDRYLGSKASAPTTLNDGSTPLGVSHEGIEYWNSTTSNRWTWTGSTWILTTATLANTAADVGLVDLAGNYTANQLEAAMLEIADTEVPGADITLNQDLSTSTTWTSSTVLKLTHNISSTFTLAAGDLILLNFTVSGVKGITAGSIRVTISKSAGDTAFISFSGTSSASFTDYAEASIGFTFGYSILLFVTTGGTLNLEFSGSSIGSDSTGVTIRCRSGLLQATRTLL